MFCDKCGKQVNDNDVFCTECGHKITKLNTPQANPEPMNFVPGTDVTQTPAVTQNQEVPQNPQATAMYKRKSNTGLIVTISVCVALLAILAVVLAFVIANKDTPFDDDEDLSYSQTDNNEAEKEEEEELPIINEIDDSVVKSAVAGNVIYTDFGVYVCNLTNGYEYGYNEDIIMPASAMCQVVILDTLSRSAKEYNLNLETESLYFDYMPNGKEAPTSKHEDGTYVSLKDCIEDVAVYGDNNKSNHIIDYIGYLNNDTGFNVIRNTLRENGYSNTRINRKVFIDSRYIDTTASPNVTTAKEISKIFENLINNSEFGTSTYMKNIFKSISNNGEAIGLKKYVPGQYDICSVNAINSQSTNDVAIISDGNTEVLVAILSCTQESETDIEDNDAREYVQSKIIEHIIETQFE